MVEAPEKLAAREKIMPVKQKQKWIIEDHLCRECGGRILRCVEGNGVTPGGNPIFKCADCGLAKPGMKPDVLCWCGFSHRRNAHITPYRCLPFSILEERPELLENFYRSGCDPKVGEVGIVLERDVLK